VVTSGWRTACILNRSSPNFIVSLGGDAQDEQMNEPRRLSTLAEPRPETPAEREHRRRKLRRLDRCLDLLESAMERDRTIVDSQAAAVLVREVPMRFEGMALSDAIEVVLLYQEAYMRSASWPGVQARPTVDQPPSAARAPAQSPSASAVPELSPTASRPWSAGSTASRPQRPRSSAAA
jgi:hypothetical protein